MKEPYLYVPHIFRTPKRGGKAICQRCGLVALKNPLTQWSIEKGCYFEDHPENINKIKQYTRRN